MKIVNVLGCGHHNPNLASAQQFCIKTECIYFDAFWNIWRLVSPNNVPGTMFLVLEDSPGTPTASFYSSTENKGRLSSVLILQICEIEPGPVGLRYSWIASVQE